jgi:hypothetical protein
MDEKMLCRIRASFISQLSTVTGVVWARDITCRMPDHISGTQVAHLCPGHESEWFRQNSMSVYNTDLKLDPDNLLNDLSNVAFAAIRLPLYF